jgi:hypothetical protein
MWCATAFMGPGFTMQTGFNKPDWRLATTARGAYGNGTNHHSCIYTGERERERESALLLHTQNQIPYFLFLLHLSGFLV